MKIPIILQNADVSKHKIFFYKSDKVKLLSFDFFDISLCCELFEDKSDKVKLSYELLSEFIELPSDFKKLDSSSIDFKLYFLWLRDNGLSLFKYRIC